MISRKVFQSNPNPITGSIVQLKMYGQLKGDYIINLYDIHSEKVMSNKITHNGNDKVISVDLDKNLPNGTSSQMLSCLHVGVERRYSARGVGVEGSITIIIISD